MVSHFLINYSFINKFLNVVDIILFIKSAPVIFSEIKSLFAGMPLLVLDLEAVHLATLLDLLVESGHLIVRLHISHSLRFEVVFGFGFFYSIF